MNKLPETRLFFWTSHLHVCMFTTPQAQSWRIISCFRGAEREDLGKNYSFRHQQDPSQEIPMVRMADEKVKKEETVGKLFLSKTREESTKSLKEVFLIDCLFQGVNLDQNSYLTLLLPSLLFQENPLVHYFLQSNSQSHATTNSYKVFQCLANSECIMKMNI